MIKNTCCNAILQQVFFVVVVGNALMHSALTHIFGTDESVPYDGKTIDGAL